MAGEVEMAREIEEDLAEVVDVSSDDEGACSAHPGLLPLQFRGYRRGRELGRGASGKVFSCSRIGCSGRLAVKAIDLRRMHLSVNAERERTLLRREVEILRTLPPHPNIVQMVDAFEERSWFLMILELVSGGDLFTALAARTPQRFHEHEAAFVMRQVGSGLSFLHAQRVIHRDLKLENVLISKERREGSLVLYYVKITDFGLSKAVGCGSSQAYSLVGTRPYTAPEVEQRSVYDFSSDLWCLGIFLYVMLAGRFPFNSIPKRQSDLYRIAQGLGCSEEGRSIVCGLLQLDPANRLTLDTLQSLEWLQYGHEKGQSKRRCVSAREASPIIGWTKSFGPESCFMDDISCQEPCDLVEPVPSADECAPPSTTCSMDMEECMEEAFNPDCAAGQASAGKSGAHHLDKKGIWHLQQVEQHYIRLDDFEKDETLTHILDALDFDQAIIFVNSSWQAIALEKMLTGGGFPSVSIHSDLAETSRIQQCQCFRDFEKRILVSTDLVDSGVSTLRVNLVLNYDVPSTSDRYLSHAMHNQCLGTHGCMITFVVTDEDEAALNNIQKRLGVTITAMLEKVEFDCE